MAKQFVGYAAFSEGAMVEVKLFEEEPRTMLFSKWLKKEDAPGYFLLALENSGRLRILNDAHIEEINGVPFVSLSH